MHGEVLHCAAAGCTRHSRAILCHDAHPANVSSASDIRRAFRSLNGMFILQICVGIADINSVSWRLWNARLCSKHGSGCSPRMIRCVRRFEQTFPTTTTTALDQHSWLLDRMYCGPCHVAQTPSDHDVLCLISAVIGKILEKTRLRT